MVCWNQDLDTRGGHWYTDTGVLLLSGSLSEHSWGNLYIHIHIHTHTHAYIYTTWLYLSFYVCLSIYLSITVWVNPDIINSHPCSSAQKLLSHLLLFLLWLLASKRVLHKTKECSVIPFLPWTIKHPNYSSSLCFFPLCHSRLKYSSTKTS